MELGISALSPTVGLSGLPDPMGDATAVLEARRRQQIEGAGYDPDQGLYDRYSAMLGLLGPTIAERSRAAADAMRRGDMGAYQKIATDIALDFGGFLGSIKGVRNPIRAYHGSPHDFDKFSMDKIGTGEGAQAYGHGLYFAEAEDVAQTYRDSLSRRNVTGSFDGMPLESPKDWWSAVDKMNEKDWRIGKFLDLYGRVGGDKDWFVRQMRTDYADQPKMLAALDDFSRRMDASYRPGKMYEVNIHADPGRFLDWDAPLSRQPKEFAAAIRDFEQNMGGPQPKMTFGDALRTDSSLEDLAREAGIPGIKYLDQGSRAAGDGSRNYVVFDDKLIEILRKYGIMAPLAGAGIGSLYMGDEEGM